MSNQLANDLQLAKIRIEDLERAIRKAIRSAEANGMGEWKQFKILRKALGG